MIRTASFGLLLALGIAFAAPAAARDPHAVQFAAQQQMRSGEVMSLRQIETRVVPAMSDMEYLGLDDYDEVNQVYRLRFINGNRVYFVYVNARNGQVIRVR